MIKFYLITVMIYFAIYIVSGILMRKQFIKARNKLRKETNDNSKIYGYIRTTIDYLLISFIPIVRLITLILKYYLIANTDDFIKMMKEKGDSNE
jgi:hypothetical protein